MAPAPQRLPDRPVAADTLAQQAGRVAAGYRPAYVVVDDTDAVILFSRGTGRFLDPAGATTLHLPSLLPPELGTELRELMRWSRATGRPGRTDALSMQTGQGPSRMTLTVEPLPPDGAAPGRLMVLFQVSGPAIALPGPDRQALVAGLQADLHLARDRLQSVTEELAFSNEEFRTTTEELETSNEELGATSEELRTTNEALTARVGELDQANSDIRNMLQSTRIAIVFLDEALRIRSFTPAIRDLFHLIDQDVGRPLADLATPLAYPSLLEDLSRVLRTQATLEREAIGLAGTQRYFARMLPYRDADGRTAGVVLAFIDVTAAHQADQALRNSEEKLHRMAASVPAFLFIAGPAGDCTYVNPPFHAFTGMAAADTLGQGWLAAMQQDDFRSMRAAWHIVPGRGDIVEHEVRFRRADGAWHWFLLRAVPQTDRDGGVVRWFGSCTDIDERRKVEARQSHTLAQLQHRVKNILSMVRSLLTRTLETSGDLDHFAHHFAGRIGALGRVQTVAARTPDHRVMLEELVREELSAHGAQNEAQARVDGPDVSLSEKTAGIVGLAMHELITNALKYGALSVPSAHLNVVWTVDRQAGNTACLVVDWRETGVPLTDMNPRRRGFGRELIEQGLPYELGAATTFQFRPGGLHCRISMPLPSFAGIVVAPE